MNNNGGCALVTGLVLAAVALGHFFGAGWGFAALALLFIAAWLS